ncbi:MAG TPA: ornithine--oxo-acid transaminase [Candidatus Gastranaerophilales bacterium]|nr:ornithine--oxo-acid transaminase [Candidatus Gastranaerophilales bacterium]
MLKKLTSADYIELENKLGASNYSPLDLVIEKAEGVWLYDVEGNRYLDCTSAFSSVNLGHCHPKLVEALTKQAAISTQVSRALRNTQLPLFYEELTQLTGKNKVLPMNTGGEAVETAVKLARKWAYTVKGIEKNTAEIIVCNNNFHGRTTTVISFSSQQAYKEYFGPHTPGFKIIPFGDIQAFKDAITPNTCAFLIEPIQGEGGVIIPPEGFLKQAEIVCKENNILLMLDEIQTGFGRTGKLFAHHYEEVNPDVLIVGKSISGGFYPVSAVLADESIMDVFKPGDHGSTFAGNPLACAVSRKAMQVLREEKIVENCAEISSYFMEKLKTLKNPCIAEIRGRGLFIAIELDEPARPYCDELLKKGLVCKETHSTIIRIAPPLVITKEQADFIFDCLKQVFEKA